MTASSIESDDQSSAKAGKARVREGEPLAGSLDRPSYLLVGDLPPPEHGSALSFQMLCRELAARGCNCKIVNVMRRKASPPSRLSLARSFELFIAISKFIAALSGSKYRRVYIIISQSWAGFIRDMLMIWIARLFHCVVIVQLRGGNYDGFYRSQSALRQRCIRWTLGRVHHIIALSEQMRDMYSFDPQLRDRVIAVSNSPPNVLRGTPRNWEGRANRPVRLLFLSNLMQSKGYCDVLEAAAILRHAPLPFELLFAGRFLQSIDDETTMPPALAEAIFRQRIEAKGLEDVVRYLGPVAGKRKWRQLQTSDFFLLPTNYRHEGQPVSIIEAMAHGCVVIATKFRSIPEMVLDGETGVLVDYGQPEQIAEAVLRIANDPQRYAAMSKAAVAHYERHFTIERHMNKMISVLEAA